MNACRRCSILTDDFHILRLGGVANENECRRIGIAGRYNEDHDTYNIALCNKCKSDFLIMLEMWSNSEAMKTTYTCTVGHRYTIRQDLGDPADGEVVSRETEDVRSGGCKEHIILPNGSAPERCGRRVRITREPELDLERYYQ